MEIEKYISICPGKYYSEFYIGITNDSEERLFSQHKVDRIDDCWAYRQAIDV